MVPLAFPYFVFCLIGVEKQRRAFRLPGAGGEHFHCTVEPSSGHIRCRKKPPLEQSGGQKPLANSVVLRPRRGMLSQKQHSVKVDVCGPAEQLL